MKQLALFISMFITMITTTNTSVADIIEDRHGNSYDIHTPVNRIVSLSPHITELLFSLNAGDKIVATTDYSNYPPAAQKIPVIGGYQGINVEAILALQPDVVIAWPDANPHRVIEQLKALNIPVFISAPKNHQDILDDILWMAELSGTQALGKLLLVEAQSRLAKIKSYQDKAPVNVFFQLGDQPLMSQNSDTFIHQAIVMCGGRNLFADSPAPAPLVSEEAVIQADPQIIIASAKTGNQQWQQRWLRYPSMQAVANKHLYSIDPDETHRPSLRFFDGTLMLCERIDRAR
ncbi:MAG: cobalamin-binding protein [Oleibacter sp.]|nr:cobalamin-binding protein [Thalassolituus sp.]